MKTCLHLFTKESDDSVFYQIINEDINLENEGVLEYSDYYYELLDDNDKKLFDKAGLIKEKYSVVSTRTEPNEHWGEIRYLFLKPI